MRNSLPRRSLFTCAVLGLLFLVAFQGCSDEDDEDNPLDPGTSTQFTGSFVSGSDGGRMTLTIPLASNALAHARLAGSSSAHSVTVTGTLHSDVGDTTGLTGSYNEEADSLILSGGGYVLIGNYQTELGVPFIAGAYAGPSGSGAFGCAEGGSNTVTVFCGYLTDGGTFTERWNMVASGTVLTGAAVMGDGEIIPFVGTISGSGTVRTITVDQNLGDGRSLLANGTFDTSIAQAQGTWQLDTGTVLDPFGDWNASSDTCVEPPPLANSGNLE